MRKNIKLIISLAIIAIMLFSTITPTISEAYELATQAANENSENNITLDLKVKRDETDANKINITATDTEYSIVELKYVHKSIDASNISYFEENNSDVHNFNITISQNVQESFNLDGYGVYTVYAKNEKGDRMLSRIKINDPADVPDITLIKDTENPLYFTIQVTSKNNTISKLKIAKMSKSNETIDFTKEGTDIEFVQSNNINVKYTKVTEDGLYKIYAEDNQGNKATSSIYLSKTGESTPITASIESGETGTRKVTLNATDSLCNITKIKVAKKSEISGFDDFKTKGEEISFIHGKTVNITYTAPEDDTYVFFIEDESGYQKMLQKRITSSKSSMALNITQDQENPGKITISGTNTITNITSMKVLVGDNVTLSEVKTNGENISITPGKTVTANYTMKKNGVINVYIEDEQGYGYMKSQSIIGIDSPSINVPPTIALTQNGDNLKQIDVTVSDSDSYIKKVKWAKGSQTAEYFSNNGTQIGQGSLGKIIITNFSIDTVGTYTVYAEDDSGNKVVKEINITSIEKPTEDITPPEISINQKNVDDTTVTVGITATDTQNPIEVIKIASGAQNLEYFKTNGQELETTKNGNSSTASLNITKNGTYTVYSKDVKGNETVKTFEVTSIKETPTPEPSDTTPPTIEIQKNVSDDNKKVYVTIEAKDSESQISKIKMENGSKDLEYFKNASNSKN